MFNLVSVISIVLLFYKKIQKTLKIVSTFIVIIVKFPKTKYIYINIFTDMNCCFAHHRFIYRTYNLLYLDLWEEKIKLFYYITLILDCNKTAIGYLNYGYLRCPTKWIRRPPITEMEGHHVWSTFNPYQQP